MGTTIRLKPRSTRLFENENKIRLSPNGPAGENADNLGRAGDYQLGGLAETQFDSGLTRNIKRPGPHGIAAIRSATDNLVGELMGNKTFTIRNQPDQPEYFQGLFIDQDDSVTEGIVTVNYDDETDTARSDVWQITIDGKGPHTTSYKVKTINSVTGTGFTGTIAAVDTFLFAPWIDDTNAAILLSSSISVTQEVIGDPNKANVGVNGQAAYVESDGNTTDKTFLFSLKPPPAWITGITQVSITMYYKNLGATTNGIDLVIQPPQGGAWVVVSGTTGNHTETSAGASASTGTLTVNPATGLAWTKSDIAGLKVGATFKGEATIVKRVLGFRVTFPVVYTGFVHPVIDGSDPANEPESYKAVNDDPFQSPDNSSYATLLMAQNGQATWPLENLPAEAASVISVGGYLTWTQEHVGRINSTGGNDYPCRAYSVTREGNEAAHYLEGPYEQSNIGGTWVFGLLPSSKFITGRQFANRGDPPDGCGAFQDTTVGQEGPGFGEFHEISGVVTTNSSSNPITVSEVNAMRLGVREGSGYPHPIYVSQVYADVEYRRNPVGTGTPYLHLVIDDDPETPDDTNYMASQHSANKKMAVDFAGIPEVLEIGWVRSICRAKCGSGSTAGWRITWRLGTDAGSDVSEAVQLNTRFENLTFTRNLSPFTGLAWTRNEVNSLVVIWESMGENDYVEKQISSLIIEADLELIPDKVDAARDNTSRRLRLLRKPRPWLDLELPPEFADVRMLDDVSVWHNAIPRTEDTQGFERWDRSMMRLCRKRISMQRDKVIATFLDVREFLTTLWITGSTRSKGQTAEGMAVLTPGVSLNFLRPTNDYIQDDYAGQFQELKGDEPPTGEKGILVVNGSTNRVVNAGFSEGATNVFTGWSTAVGAGGAIVEDATDPLFAEDIQGNRPRTVKITTPTTPANKSQIYRSDISVERGDSPITPEGSDYAVSVIHQDDDGYPLSLQFEIDPPGFSNYNFDKQGAWTAKSGDGFWFDLPVRAEPTKDTFEFSLAGMELIPTNPATETLDMLMRLSGQTSAGAVNRVYGVQVEGGRIADELDQRYAGNFILTRNGPVVRDGLTFYIENIASRPVYPVVGRGTFGVRIETLWDSSRLPRSAGRRRYVYGMIMDSTNYDALWYDVDDEKFIFERKVLNVASQSEVWFPEVKQGQPIDLAVRWISDLGDLDLTPRSFNLFVNKVKGSTGSHIQTMPIPTKTILYLGSRDGTDGEMLDGWLRKLEIKQLALTDDAIGRLFT